MQVISGKVYLSTCSKASSPSLTSIPLLGVCWAQHSCLTSEALMTNYSYSYSHVFYSYSHVFFLPLTRYLAVLEIWGGPVETFWAAPTNFISIFGILKRRQLTPLLGELIAVGGLGPWSQICMECPQVGRGGVSRQIASKWFQTCSSCVATCTNCINEVKIYFGNEFGWACAPNRWSV